MPFIFNRSSNFHSLFIIIFFCIFSACAYHWQGYIFVLSRFFAFSYNIILYRLLLIFHYIFWIIILATTTSLCKLLYLILFTEYIVIIDYHYCNTFITVTKCNHNLILLLHVCLSYNIFIIFGNIQYLFSLCHNKTHPSYFHNRLFLLCQSLCNIIIAA